MVALALLVKLILLAVGICDTSLVVALNADAVMTGEVYPFGSTVEVLCALSLHNNLRAHTVNASLDHSVDCALAVKLTAEDSPDQTQHKNR